jgi:hypothetical protein
MQAAKPGSSAPARNPRPIFLEDDGAELGTDSEVQPSPAIKPPCQGRPTPLKELSPNLSPRKAFQSPQKATESRNSPAQSKYKSPKTILSAQRSDAVSAKVEGLPLATRPDLSTEIQQLLQKSRPNSASGKRQPQPLKNRPLGRASSGISNRSGSASHTSESGQAPLPLDGAFDSALEAESAPHGIDLPQSTQLSYETADSEAMRLKLNQHVGSKMDNGGLQRVASLGTVKDNVPDGVGSRTKARHKGKQSE